MTPMKETAYVLTGPLDLRNHDVARYSPYLSDDEREKQQRFRTQALRDHYALSRGILRETLGRALGRAPGGLTLAYGEHGKPYLIDGGVEFNLSHSHDYLLIGLSDQPIGVDVEHERASLEPMSLAQRFFADSEIAWLESLPESALLRGFYQLWVCKEAVIKAIGVGLNASLKDTEIAIEQGQARLLSTPENGEGLRVQLIDAPLGYHAAVCFTHRF